MPDEQLDLFELKVAVLDGILGSLDANMKLLEAIKYNISMIELRISRALSEDENSSQQ